MKILGPPGASLGLVLLLVGCTEPAPPAQRGPTGDGCYAYVIHPDGSRDCMRCPACEHQPS